MIPARVLKMLAPLGALMVLLAITPRAGAADDVEFFEKKIRPLLAEHCYECHSSGAKKLKANLLLDTKQGSLKGGETGPAIVPGDLDKSLLIKAVRYKDENLQMPPDKKLSDAQIADLEAWVRLGAPDPRTGPAPAKPADGSGGIDLAEGRKWWAFQPVKDHPAPSVKRTDWPRGTIDRFILAKLEAQNLSPAKPADKRTLIRRAYYDLIGLPPTPAEVEAFVADNSPDAFAKVIDHLLALPQYGERWGRHWLDVVRYTDSFDSRGIGGEADVPFAWRYRDWVVSAFNRDLPYDQFIKHQIAGDLSPASSPGEVNKEGIIATGVYVIGEWGVGDADKEKMLTDIVDDQIDLTSRAFLGMTLSCARCHDHKFDPLSTQDYYGLAGIFFSTRILPNPGQKTAGSPNLRVTLLDQAEREKREADAEREAELSRQITALLDEQYGRIAESMIARVDKYLAAAWEYKTLPLRAGGAQPPVAQFAAERDLHGYALSQWLSFVGSPTFKLFPNAVKDVNGIKGVDAWQNPDASGTPIVIANKTAKPVQLLPTLMLAPKSLNMHPSPTAGVAVAWRSPIAGKVRVTGKVADSHNTCGDGITWSVTRIGGAGAGELASGTIANGGEQPLPQGTGGKHLEAIEIAEGEMIQLAILPKADHSCDTTNVQFTITEIGGAGDVWNLVEDVVSNLRRGNPHPDSYGNAKVWHFHDMTGQAQAAFAAGSAMAKFTNSITADTDMKSVRAAAAEVRKALDAVGTELRKFKEAGQAAPTLTSPDASFYQTLADPRSPFWQPTRGADSNLPPDARREVVAMRTELAAVRQALAQAVEMAHAMQEGGVPQSMFPGFQDVPVHIRGSYTRLGEVVPRRFPQVIAGEQQPPIKNGSGRKELAEWVASSANPLTARVMANRIWLHHFGEGLVRTANNFGTLGTPPTHPELLDHLASRFVQHGWSIKAMHREIMLSAAYQQSSTADPVTLKADPDNLLVGRMNRRRLDAEALRDSLLSVTDRLDRKLGGPATNDINIARRTLYVMTVRSDRTTYRNLFDAADAATIVEKRIDSTVAPQALFLLNNPFALTQTKFLAQRAVQQGGEDDAAKIDWLYRTLFSRPPIARELEIGTTALANFRESKPGEATTPEMPWEAYCQVLLCSNEFMYVD